MTKEKSQELIKAKVEKISKLAQELQVQIKAVLMPTDNSITATVVFKDEEKYPEDEVVAKEESAVTTDEVKEESTEGKVNH